MNLPEKAILTLVLLFSGFVLSGTSVVYAQTQPEKDFVIAELVQEIELLLSLLNQRLELGEIEPFTVEDDVSQYFFLRESTNSETKVYGSEVSKIIIEADAGVTQILIEQDCLDGSFVTYQEQANATCVSDLWKISPEDDGGVITFEIPVYYAKTPTKEVVLTISACRFNGCAVAQEITISYKERKEFLDSVNIVERYGYEYEYDESVYFVQEFMIDFGGQRVRSAKVGIRCDDYRAIRTRESEKQRISCSEAKSKIISRSIIDYDQTDEQGNTYDLLLEFFAEVTETQVDGVVTVEFEFRDMSNRVHTTTHQLQITA